MLTRFISDKTFKSLDFEYKFDNDIKINSYQIGVDGNLNYTITPSLSSIKDLKVNDYVLNILTGNEKLTKFLSLTQLPETKNDICYIFYNPSQSSDTIDNNTKFWKIESNFVSVSTSPTNFNDFNIFEVEFLDDLKCKIYYNGPLVRYALAYSIALSSVNFVPLSSNNFQNYSTTFDCVYNKDENQIIFYVNSNLGQYAIINRNNKLFLKGTNQYSASNGFFIKRIEGLKDINTTNDWVSYKNSFNKKDLEINENKSYYDVQNNFLFSSLINSISSTIPINILTLKNQLNQENEQGRGNVFLNENETNLKEYESIFTGGFRELGFEKINVGYTSYSKPYKFKSGKTTYFHVPHEIYPYKKLNINSSKLAESGSVAGNCPLNSDKIWKKLADYKNTSPFGNAQEENTGQFLCTWLSAGSFGVRPIWVDRFYKPDLITPFQAASAIQNEIKYKSSFDCYDIAEGVKDYPSSLTFEKGCYYAYMHLGKRDYENLIKTLSGDVFYDNLDDYKKTNFSDLDVNSKVYDFDGRNFGVITLDKIFNYNNISFSFFAEKGDWSKPTGHQIFGNYTNKGFGFFDYELSNPYILLKRDSNNIQVLNNNFEEISNFSSLNITNSAIKGVSRRNNFENIHFITEDFQLIEIDLNGTIVDINSNLKSILSGNYIVSTTNDMNNCYVQSNSAVIKIDLNTNDASVTTITNTVGTGANSYLVSDGLSGLYVIKGENPNLRGDKIYFIDKNQIKVFSISSSSTDSFISIEDNVLTFNIDYDGKIYLVSKNKLYVYDDQYNLSTITSLSSVDSYSLTANSLFFLEKFEYGNLKKHKNIFLNNNSESYIISIDENNQQILKKLNYNYSSTQPNSIPSNHNFNTQYFIPFYGKNYYNFKVKLQNQLDTEDFETLNFIIKNEDLALGKRHFIFTINCLKGYADFYLDGVLYERKNFQAGKYAYSNIFEDVVYYGCDTFFNGIPSFQHFKDPSDYTYGDLKMEKIYILNKFLDDSQVRYFYCEEKPPTDLVYNMPCGTMSYIDMIDKIFNFNIPQYKSSVFELNILNSGLFYNDIRKDLENYIGEKLLEFLPAYSNLRKINWLDTIIKPIYLQGDYNQSNTLTNIQ
jgi:hypothetical protein